jgi:hypothetical protein
VFFLTAQGNRSVRTLENMSRQARRQDNDLRRYFAYRCHVWMKDNPGAEWKDLAMKLGVKPPEVTAFKEGRNASPGKIANFTNGLGPQSSDLFQQLAREWAEQYPEWEPKDPLPERITHTGDPLLDGTAGGTTVYSESFRDAARALSGLMGCTIEQSREAAHMAWRAHPHHEDDAVGWVVIMKPYVKQLMRASGERPSYRALAAAPKTDANS